MCLHYQVYPKFHWIGKIQLFTIKNEKFYRKDKCVCVCNMKFNLAKASVLKIEVVSFQTTNFATCYSKGVAALALMKNITKLRELDISHNRNIDDMAILSIHNGLKLKKRESEENCRNGDKENEMQPQAPSTNLVSSHYVFIFNEDQRKTF